MARICTGVAIGGSFPVLFAFSADVFPASQRALVSGALAAAGNVGAALGGLMAGVVGPSYGWRLPFTIIAVPTLACALLVRLLLADPRSQQKAKKRREEPVNEAFQAWMAGAEARGAGLSMEDLDLSKFQKVFQVRSNVLVFAQASHLDSICHVHIRIICMYVYHIYTYVLYVSYIIKKTLRTFPGIFSLEHMYGPTGLISHVDESRSAEALPGCIPISVIVTFLADYLATDQGMAVEASTAITAVFGLSCLCFGVTGGFLGQKLWNLRHDMLLRAGKLWAFQHTSCFSFFLY